MAITLARNFTRATQKTKCHFDAKIRKQNYDHYRICVIMVNMKRMLQDYILEDLQKKIVLISGPRQTGKTTLSKQLCQDFDYFNYDASEDRLAIHKKNWDRSKKLVIFDELHKMKQWKRWLKGIFDTEGIPPQILVTGSAKLNIHKRVGDSLAGRYFQYHLHPLDLKEACTFLNITAEDGFETLWHCSGFPEPFLNGNQTALQNLYKLDHS